MGADYSFYVETIEIHARAFLTLTILAIGRMHSMYKGKLPLSLNHIATSMSLRSI